MRTTWNGPKRQPLTKKNLRELNIEQTWQSILEHPNLVYVDDDNGGGTSPSVSP